MICVTSIRVGVSTLQSSVEATGTDAEGAVGSGGGDCRAKGMDGGGKGTAGIDGRDTVGGGDYTTDRWGRGVAGCGGRCPEVCSRGEAAADAGTMVSAPTVGLMGRSR